MISSDSTVQSVDQDKPVGKKNDESQAVSSYLRKMNVLIIVRHLNMLLMKVQKHRGGSTAVLEGDAEFERRIEDDQFRIDRLMVVIHKVNQQAGKIITFEQWQEIERDWQALIQNWRKDSVIANFEFHSHFIERLMKLMWALIETADYFTQPQYIASSVKSGSDTIPLYSERNHIVLVQISLKLMPEMLENVARLRGLATHASVRGYCSSETRGYFTLIFQSLNQNKERLRVLSRSLEHDALRAVPALPSIMLHEHRLDQLQQLISQKIMVEDKIRITGVEVFNFATGIIEAYTQIIRDGITAFQRRIEQGVLD